MAYLTWTGINGDLETVCSSDAWENAKKKPGSVERGKVYLVNAAPDRGGEFRMECGRMSSRVRLSYTDGKSDYSLRFVDGILQRINHDDPDTVAGDSDLFATIFQFYYLATSFRGCTRIMSDP